MVEHVQTDRATNVRGCDNESAQLGQNSCKGVDIPRGANGVNVPYEATKEGEGPGSSECYHEDGEFSNPVSLLIKDTQAVGETMEQNNTG